MDEIDFEAPEIGTCACCGREQTRLTRFVTRDGDAFAVYKAVLPGGEHQRRADLIVGLGDWDEAASPDQRVAFALQVWADEAMINVAVVDAEQSAWQSGFFGRVVSREEALRHPWLQQVYDLSDQIVERDKAIIDYLERSAGRVD